MKKIIFLTLSSFLLISCSGKMIEQAPAKNLDPTFKKVNIQQGQDSLSAEQWNIKSTGLDQAWDKFHSSKAVDIMLIGTGIDYNHEDLQDNIVVKKSDDKISIGKDFVDNDDLAYDHFGHDTYLAGIIAASHDNGVGIKGILKKASLIPVRYIDKNGMTNIVLLHKALKYAAQEKPDVILLNWANISFSAEKEARDIEIKSLKEVLESLQKLEIPIVMGAGNNGKEFGTKLSSKILSNYSNIIVVTSTDLAGNKPWLASFSPVTVHTSAPGKDITTTAKGNKYEKVSGTSLAAAHVTAAIAYGISEFKGKAGVKEFKNALMSSEASTDKMEMAPYTLGRNTLEIHKFLAYLQK